MKKGDVLRVPIERLAHDGNGIAEIEGRRLPVKGAVPGDIVEISIQRIKRFSARVRLESIITEGIPRIPAECPHFSRCGGCRWQDIPYELQCSLKTGIVRETLEGLLDADLFEDLQIVPSPEVFFYRNKMEFSFDCPPDEQDVRLGLHEFGRYDRVFDVESCRLQSERSNRIVDAVRNFIREHGLSAYGLKSHTGLLRFLMIREGKKTGEVLVNLVTSGDEFHQAEMFGTYLTDEISGITTVIRSINRSPASVSFGEERAVLFGDGKLRDSIGEYTFFISPDSFFQTNTHQAENLYSTIREFAGLSGTERILDLYCGIGTIGIYLARHAGTVTGIELSGEAVIDARRNAEHNDIHNTSFIAGKAEKTISEDMGEFDVVVCDPPRAGIHPKLMRQLVKMRIPRMVYVSCNVGAIPGDIEMLMMAGYRIKKVRLFDMSPHTPHIETVLLLEISGKL